MFSQESKVAVLESKLNIYEELSREMLAKLESAVEKISESNNRIANILTKHDERIDQTFKTDQLILKMIEGVKDDNMQDHERVLSKVKSLEEKVESLTKFRWQVGGVLAVVVVLIAIIDIIVPSTIPNIQKEVVIEKIK
jgi:hypothetical protein